MKNDSLAEMFYEKIMASENPVGYLAGFFSTLFSTDMNGDTYKMFARLYKVYGREIIYFAILDCYDIESIDLTRPYGILVYFCKNRLEKKSKSNVRPDLNKTALDNLHDLSKERKYKIPEVL